MAVEGRKMSNNIKVDILLPQKLDTTAIVGMRKTNLHVSGLTEKENNDSVDTILNLSKEAKIKSKGRALDNRTVKQAGVTSARELFEDEARDWRTDVRGEKRSVLEIFNYYHEVMRIDEPETFAKSEEMWKKHLDYPSGSKEHGHYLKEYSDLTTEYCYRRLFDSHGVLQDPTSGRKAVLYGLESLYSDSIHDTTFDVYDDCFSDVDAIPWRFGTKFNVLLPPKLLKELELLNDMNRLSEEEKQNLQEKTEKLDYAVNRMKKIELDYAGDLKAVRFGVKLDNDGNVLSYHANYGGCKSKHGIIAESAEELLEQLMSRTSR